MSLLGISSARAGAIGLAGDEPSERSDGRAASHAIGSRVVAVLIGIWIVAAGAGLLRLVRYETRAGTSADPPAHWPVRSGLARTSGRATLVLFLHPNCPCSRATLEELDRLLADVHGLVTVHAVFLQSRDAPSAWDATDLWQRAGSIPGVARTRDDDGSEARLFDAATSGQVVLYDAGDRLLFSGGITDSRGHAGDNDGVDAIRALLTTHAVHVRDRTPVFGCSLRDGTAVRSAGWFDGF